MKRERNTFFTNYNAQNQSYIPNIPNNFGPYQSSNVESSYYSGPDIGNINEIDNRLSKIERQINRLDYRISRLENNETITTTTTNTTTTNNSDYQNMYMI